MFRPAVGADDQADDGNQEEEEREHGQESVEGDQCGHLPTPVVAVLLDHRDGDGGRRPGALEVIETSEEAPPEGQRATATGVN